MDGRSWEKAATWKDFHVFNMLSRAALEDLACSLSRRSWTATSRESAEAAAAKAREADPRRAEDEGADEDGPGACGGPEGFGEATGARRERAGRGAGGRGVPVVPNMIRASDRVAREPLPTPSRDDPNDFTMATQIKLFLGV